MQYEATPEPDFSNNKCRVCLTTDELFDWNANVTDADQWISNGITYAECFYESTQLSDDMEKKFPQFLCKTCKTELRATFVFICKARRSDQILRLKQEKQDQYQTNTSESFAVEKLDPGFEWVVATEETDQKDSPVPTEADDVTDLLDQLESTTANDNDDESDSNTGSSHDEAESKDAKDEEVPLSSLVSKTRHRRIKNTVEEEQPVVCQYCTEMFPREKLMRRHIARCHKQSQMFLCHACPRTFKDTSTLRQHERTHEPNRTRTFTCELCGRKFFTQSAFTTHTKTHATNRQPMFACNQCDKSFFHKGSLKLHTKTHTGENVVCNVCNKRYLRRIDLKIHLRTHSGDTPYKCHYSDCDKAFAQVSLLNKHLRYHEGYKYKCDICAKEYLHQSTLIQHHKEHTGLPLKCAICEKGFVKRSKMRRHISGVHKVEDLVEMDKLIINVKTKREYRGIQRNHSQSYAIERSRLV